MVGILKFFLSVVWYGFKVSLDLAGIATISYIKIFVEHLRAR